MLVYGVVRGTVLRSWRGMSLFVVGEQMGDAGKMAPTPVVVPVVVPVLNWGL